MFMLLYRVCTHLRLEFCKQAFVFMFVLLQRVFTIVRIRILATILCVYFLLLLMVCAHVRLVILVTILCVYVYVVLESLYTCKTVHFGKKTLYLCLCCSRGYIRIQDWEFYQLVFVFIFVLQQSVCTHVIMGMLATSRCVSVCVVLEDM